MARMGRLPAPIFDRRSALINDNKGARLQDLFSVSFEANRVVRLVERETHKFRSPAFYNALAAANSKAAVKIQQGMRDELQENIGDRPQRPGQRLQRSIMNEENRVVYANRFMVGIEAWMNKSPAALYWRQIEEGMGGYNAYVLFSGGPPFGSPSGPWSSPGQGGPHMRLAQFNNRGGTQRGGLVHFRRTLGLHYSRGGSEAFDRLSMTDLYITHLRAAGFSVNKGDYFK